MKENCHGKETQVELLPTLLQPGLGLPAQPGPRQPPGLQVMQKWPQTKAKRGRWLRRVAGCWLTCWLNETVRFGAKREGEGKKRKMAGEREREGRGEREGE